MSKSVFIAKRLISAAFSLAFASSLAQAEMFTGACGLSANGGLHIFCLAVASLGFLASSLSCVSQRAYVHDKRIILSVALVYLVYCFLQFGEVLLVDRMLVEAGLLLGLSDGNEQIVRFFVSRVLLVPWLGKISICGTVWTSFSALKSDALNQPFPFTPVWHLAQVPEMFASFLAAIIFASELILPILIVSTQSAGPLLGALFLSVCYAILGNFGWSVAVLVACIFYLLPSSLVGGILGEMTLLRWGYNTPESANQKTSEVEIFNSFRDIALSGTLILTTALGLVFGPKLQVSVASLVGIAAVVLCTLLTVYRLRRSYIGLMLALAGVVLSQTEFASIISGGFLRTQEDFSALPTCFTFEGGAHNKDSRSVFLIQTKYSVMGTNTVGSNLGGSRYAELSVPGSVHGDEVRPPFLLGHLPRLALKLWGIGTGQAGRVGEGLALMRKLETMVEKGSDGLRVMFSGTDDSVLNALIGAGKSNQVQSFAQSYQVTERVADHQWWKRNYQGVAALPTNKMPTPEVPLRCSPVLPVKIFGTGLDMILPSIVLAAVVLRLLFGPGSRNSKRKAQK